MTYTPNPDLIMSALKTAAPAPAPELEGRQGMAHWKGVCTVYTEDRRSYLVTGYDNKNPRLSACSKSVEVDIDSIYAVFDRDHRAIIALEVKNAPHCHYTGP